MGKTLFIHRSCGANLLEQGNVRSFLNADYGFEDYDHNKHVLTDAKGKLIDCKIQFFDGDTTPESYARFFDKHSSDPAMLNIVLSYDTIIIKSCYPANAIKSDAALEELKQIYIKIETFFEKRPNVRLGIVTTPPLVAVATNHDESRRAKELGVWLENRTFIKNISVFNFYTLLTGEKENVLQQHYSRWWAKLGIKDSHPNRLANETIAPLFAAWVNKISV